MKLLIVCQSQFGYHIDTWYYAKYLSTDHKVHYLSWDYGLEKKELDGVKTIYVSRLGGKISRNFRFLKAALLTIAQGKYDIVFIKYFLSCFILPLLQGRRNIVLDIRTGDVSTSYIRRTILDRIMRFETLFFKNITIISDSLRNKLNLKNCHILPLGADRLSKKSKTFESLRVLYVGTFSNRNLDQALVGFKQFVDAYGKSEITFDIVGSGTPREEQEIENYIQSNELTNVTLHGYMHHDKLSQLFDKCNIGLSYIPINSYYDFQPPTKTYEYLLSGLYVIATSTHENKLIITEENGVLIEDNPTSLFQGLKKIYFNRPSADLDFLARYTEHEWSSIVKNLECHLKKL